jgi:BatD DUF11 like domain
MVDSRLTWMRRSLYGLLLFAVALPVLAKVTVITERDTVSITDSFSIVFEVDTSVRGNPNFSPLEKDFDILSRSQSTNISIINGRQTATTRWTLDVIAKRTGTLTIPEISFGQQHSPVKKITIKAGPKVGAGQAGEDIFIEVEAQPRDPYVQAEVVYTVRLFRAVNTHNTSLSDPRVSGVKAVIEKLGDDISYESFRDGKRYQVVERKYAIFPQSSGTLTFEPVLFTGQLGSRSPLLFGPFGGQPRTTRRRSERIQLTARPIPDSFQNGRWLPTTQLQLQEIWSKEPPVFRVGEPITRTLALIADGLTAGQLPEIKPSLPPGFKQYPDQPILDDQISKEGVVGIRQEKIALIPTTDGDVVLPALDIPWWNTKQERIEHTRLPERKITVQAAAPAAAAQHVAPAATKLNPKTSTPSTAPPKAAPSKATPPITSDVRTKSSALAQEKPVFWIVVSTLLAMGWAGTAMVWWLNQRNKDRGKITNSSKSKLKLAVKRIKQGCARNSPSESKDALLRWAAIHWHPNPPTNLDSIGLLTGGPLQAEIKKLNQSLYGHHTETWTGRELWQAFQHYSTALRTFPESAEDGLEPLYRV